MEKWSGRFEMIDPRLIIVDHRYQRPEKPNLINKIAQSPDWAAFGALSLYERDTVFVVVDGQQRLRGVMSSNEPPKEVPSVVHKKAPVEQEARTFVDMNVNRTTVNALERHRGKVTAKDPDALAIEKAADEAGFTVGGTNSRSITAIGAIYHTFAQLGEDGLVQVLVQLRDSWPDDQAALGVGMIRGVCDTIVEQGNDYHRAKLTDALKKTTPSAILRKAEEFHFKMGGSQQVNIRRAIVELCKV